jgi:ABC-type transport system involved in multi-copper enzyme maturation permease subunit
MAGGCLLVTPVLGAIPMARERRERSCDLLATAPIGRHVHIFSKLGVFVLASTLPPGLCLLAAAALAERTQPFASLILVREPSSVMAMAFAALGGMSWLMGSFLKSEAIAAGCTYLIVLSAVVSWALLAERYQTPAPEAMGWYMTIMATLCIVGLVLGTAVSLVRRVW